MELFSFNIIVVIVFGERCGAVSKVRSSVLRVYKEIDPLTFIMCN